MKMMYPIGLCLPMMHPNQETTVKIGHCKCIVGDIILFTIHVGKN